MWISAKGVPQLLCLGWLALVGCASQQVRPDVPTAPGDTSAVHRDERRSAARGDDETSTVRRDGEEPPPREGRVPAEAWLRAHLAGSYPSCANSMRVGKPIVGRFFEPTREDAVYPIDCDEPIEVPHGYHELDEATGESVWIDAPRAATKTTTYLVFAEAEERFHEPVCQTDEGIESSWDCAPPLLLRGGPNENDAFLILEQGCSDAGCDAILTVYSPNDDRSRISLPDERSLMHATVQQDGAAVIVEGSVNCNAAEQEIVPGHDCRVPAKYRLTYERGEAVVERL